MMQGWSLIVLSALLAGAFSWSFGRLSNQRGIAETNRRIAAHMYELRLFDEPGLIWKAQVELLRETAKRIGLLLIPTVILAVPMLFVLALLDAAYGVRPAKPGESVIITAQLYGPLDARTEAPRLHLPQEFVAETAPVRAIAERQVSWRVHATKPASGVLLIETDDGPASKALSSDPATLYLSKRRVSSVLGFLEHPTEAPMFHNGIAWIEVAYPKTNVRWLGLEFQWLIWLALVMTLVWVVWKPLRMSRP